MIDGKPGDSSGDMKEEDRQEKGAIIASGSRDLYLQS